MPAVLTAQSTRVEAVMHLPLAVLRRHHAGFVLGTLYRDSEGMNDLIAEGHLKLVKLDRKLDQNMDPEEFKKRCAGTLKKFYLRRYLLVRGRPWRNVAGKLVNRQPRPEILTVPDDVFRGVAGREESTAEGESVWQEALEFLDGLGTAKSKAVRGLLAGKTKSEVAAELGMSPQQLTAIVERAAAQLKAGGVL